MLLAVLIGCVLVSMKVYIIVVAAVALLICDASAEDICGTTISKRVVGGDVVDSYKYPWFTILRNNTKPKCGGTLVTSKHVVTAAHCFFKNKQYGKMRNEDMYIITLGASDRCIEDSRQKNYKAAKVVIHERHEKEFPYYDVAVITLDGDASSFVPACLPNKKISVEERPKEGLVIGYGREGMFEIEQPCRMREAVITIGTDEDCQKTIDSSPYTALHQAFCAGSLNGTVDTCQGDSGGPLLYPVDRNIPHTLLGITSWGIGCAWKDRLGVYTDVSLYLDWIKERIQ